jgi:hypothetical protein
MQPKIEKEVAFLSRLRRRFASQNSYKNVINDMHDEGLITDTAYREIMSLYSKPTPRTKSAVKTSAIKKSSSFDYSNTGCQGGSGGRRC